MVAIPRRRVRLPSLDALRVFEVTARLLSFTKAAIELNVTQSAISHRIRCLELSLGKRLLRRGASGLELTPMGATIAAGVARAVEEVWSAIEEADNGVSGKSLTLSVPSSFAAHWLTPRLSRFCAAHPGIELTVWGEDRAGDLTAGPVDARIEFSLGGDRPLHSTFLMPDNTIPVCSPEALRRFGPLRSPADVAKFPLLYDRTAEQDASASGWRSWLAGVGVPDLECRSGMRFNDTGLVLNAAVAGLGLALVRTSLIGAELRAGRLVCPLPYAVPTRYAYHFVSLAERQDDPKVRALRNWLSEEAKAVFAEAPHPELIRIRDHVANDPAPLVRVMPVAKLPCAMKRRAVA